MEQRNDRQMMGDLDLEAHLVLFDLNLAHQNLHFQYLVVMILAVRRKSEPNGSRQRKGEPEACF